jgi:hypothetical protein
MWPLEATVQREHFL